IARTLPDWIWTNGEGVAVSKGRIEKAGRVEPGGVAGRRVQAVSTAATHGNRTRARTILPSPKCTHARERSPPSGRRMRANRITRLEVARDGVGTPRGLQEGSRCKSGPV